MMAWITQRCSAARVLQLLPSMLLLLLLMAIGAGPAVQTGKRVCVCVCLEYTALTDVVLHGVPR